MAKFYREKRDGFIVRSYLGLILTPKL